MMSLKDLIVSLIYLWLDLRISLNFAHICQKLFKLSVKLFFSTDFSSYCEEWNIELLINVHI